MPVGVFVVYPDGLDRERHHGVSYIDLNVVDDMVRSKDLVGRSFSDVFEASELDGFDIWMALFEQTTTHEVGTIFGTTCPDVDHWIKTSYTIVFKESPVVS